MRACMHASTTNPTPTQQPTNPNPKPHQPQPQPQVRVPSYYGGTLSMHAFLTPKAGTFEQRVATAPELVRACVRAFVV